MMEDMDNRQLKHTESFLAPAHLVQGWHCYVGLDFVLSPLVALPCLSEMHQHREGNKDASGHSQRARAYRACASGPLTMLAMSWPTLGKWYLEYLLWCYTHICVCMLMYKMYSVTYTATVCEKEKAVGVTTANIHSQYTKRKRDNLLHFYITWKGIFSYRQGPFILG